MKIRNIEVEKLLFLVSGLVDKGLFNNRIKKLRKELSIPSKGIQTNEESEKWHKELLEKSDIIMASKEWQKKIKKLDKEDPEFTKKNRELHREIPLNQLWYEIDDIISENPDLNINIKSTIHSHILFGKSVILGGSNYSVFSETENGKESYGLRVYGRMSKKDFSNAVKVMELLNKRLPKIAPSPNIEKDIKILKLSKNKGKELISTMPDIENTNKFNDENIISAILPEAIDNIGNLKRNKDYIRKRRSLAEKRLRILFPNTYKG